jgi:hypothetical protein
METYTVNRLVTIGIILTEISTGDDILTEEENKLLEEVIESVRNLLEDN